MRSYDGEATVRMRSYDDKLGLAQLLSDIFVHKP